MGWGNFLKAVASNIDIFAGPVVTLLYPLYASIRAIETPSRLDDQQWLTYWVLYSFITLFELSFSKILVWLPFWSYLKLVATCWLVLPMFNGAAYVYENYVRKCILNPKFDSRFNPVQKKLVNMINPSTRGVVERYIEENGQDAFDRLIRKTAGLCFTMKPQPAGYHDDTLSSQRNKKNKDGIYKNVGSLSIKACSILLVPKAEKEAKSSNTSKYDYDYDDRY